MAQPQGISADLAWWRAHRDGADPEAARRVLARLTAWKVQHDEDRARQAGPFFKMVWDGIFGDDDGAVTEAIAEIETALADR
ncbi:hypothetical protein [Phenylobacterium kunshanense]|uniref:Uncharacterized protein n=1 Tax=Phenylobacterium kunshanense TaxID=1445034 RepID=A0A328BAJ5_9CAUL|nr:hypothetical protein [Phenylobacterium kunshanense]RAK64342.1 hypothetical protein DJ019_14315 [Phenylobacterium kunshanense]